MRIQTILNGRKEIYWMGIDLRGVVKTSRLRKNNISTIRKYYSNILNDIGR
jgi:hypothetical protein